jgi:hypothetical protein
MTRWLSVVVGALLLGWLVLPAWADTPITANQGKPGNQGPWPVLVSGNVNIVFDGGCSFTGGSIISTGPDGGSVLVHAAIPECSRIVQTNDAGIGTSPARVPGTPTVGRTWIRICNSLLNTSSAVCICSAMDCPASVAVGAVGDVLATADCVTYGIGTLDGGVPCCVCNGASTFLPASECIP